LKPFNGASGGEYVKRRKNVNLLKNFKEGHRKSEKGGNSSCKEAPKKRSQKEGKDQQGASPGRFSSAPRSSIKQTQGSLGLGELLDGKTFQNERGKGKNDQVPWRF